MLNERQICLLSNSAIQYNSLVEKVASKQISRAELVEALAEIENVVNCLRIEIEYGLDVTEVESNIAN